MVSMLCMFKKKKKKAVSYFVKGRGGVDRDLCNVKQSLYIV